MVTRKHFSIIHHDLIIFLHFFASSGRFSEYLLKMLYKVYNCCDFYTYLSVVVRSGMS